MIAKENKKDKNQNEQTCVVQSRVKAIWAGGEGRMNAMNEMKAPSPLYWARTGWHTATCAQHRCRNLKGNSRRLCSPRITAKKLRQQSGASSPSSPSRSPPPSSSSTCCVAAHRQPDPTRKIQSSFIWIQRKGACPCPCPCDISSYRPAI
jgi:hypothetical protein